MKQPKQTRSRVADIIQAIDCGKTEKTTDDLLPLVYDELRRLARAKLANESPGQTIQATSLVHDAYLRLIGNDSQISWNSQGHFFAAAAESMRRILIENARRKGTLKHGGDYRRLELNSEFIAGQDRSNRIMELDAAIEKLAATDELKATLVKLKLYAGLSMSEAGRAWGYQLQLLTELGNIAEHF